VSDPSPHNRTLLKVMVLSTALSFGCLGAIIASMRGFFHGDASFHFSIRTILGFVVGAIAGWLFWKLLLRLKKERPQ